MDIIYIDGVKWFCTKWNGEFWYDCWNTKNNISWCIKPVYRWEQEEVTSLEDIEENSPEWERLCEVVDYIIFI